MGKRHARAARPRRRSGSSCRWLGALALLGLLAAPPLGAAGTGSASEAEVKAAFLLNFTRYVEWPAASFAGAGAPFVICVLDDAEFAATVTRVIGVRTVSERPVSVDARASLAEVGGCHILYLPSSRSGLHEQVIAELAAQSVFTVSDSDGFAKMGGVANFTRAGSKLGVEINRAAADRAKLEVSARLLRIAEVVG